MPKLHFETSFSNVPKEVLKYIIINDVVQIVNINNLKVSISWKLEVFIH